jgi:L-2,4-diaminobutyric acid acetyltransferase
MHSDSTHPGSAIEAARHAVLAYRQPVPGDAPRLHALVAASPPLDLNSTYAYLLVGAHFADTSVVVERDGALAGFLSAYRKPSEPDVLFVWQVAVSASARGLGVGRRMLRHVLARPSCSGVGAVETTITPSNDASWRLFRALARELGAIVAPVATFDGHQVGGADHEEEQLIRIGPVRSRSSAWHGGT